MGFAALGGRESGEEDFDRELRGDLTLFLTSDTVSEGEHAAVRPQLRGSVGQHVAEVVLVVVAGASGVGKLGEFYVEHGAGWILRDWQMGSVHGVHKVKGGPEPALGQDSREVMRWRCESPPAWCVPWSCWSAGSRSRRRGPRRLRYPELTAAPSWCHIP